MINFFKRAPTVGAWTKRDMAVIAQRLEAGDILKTTFYNRRALVRKIDDHIGSIRLDRVSAPDVMRLIHGVQADGHYNSAQRARSLLIRLYYEAAESGVVPAGYNPALSVRAPRAPVQRNRLSLAVWQQMLATAKDSQYPYLYRGMLLAVVTGQRRGDIARMQFDHIADGFLRVEQTKTGARVAIPLALRCEAIGWSLADVIELCRDGSGCPYLLHTTLNPVRNINRTLLSARFRALRHSVCGPWIGDGTPPTFHEQRSLSERLYSEQGIDTRKLLGHRRQHMTDMYNSDRRLREWVTIPLNGQSGVAVVSKHYKWQARWTVDDRARTATHDSGLVVMFYDPAVAYSTLHTVHIGLVGGLIAVSDHNNYASVQQALESKNGPHNAPQMMARLGREALEIWSDSLKEGNGAIHG